MKNLKFTFQTSPNFSGVTEEFEFSANNPGETIEKIKSLLRGSGIKPEEGEAFLVLRNFDGDNYDHIEIGDIGERLDGSYRFVVNEEFLEIFPQFPSTVKNLELEDFDLLEAIISNLFEIEFE
jgi:hypothetical protein